MSIGRIVSKDLNNHHNFHFTDGECRAQRSEPSVMTQQVIKMSLKIGFPGFSSDLSDGLHALPALPPLPCLPPPPPSKPCKTTKIAAFPHRSLACSWGKSDYNSVGNFCCNKNTHHKDDHYQGQKKDPSAASGLTPCRADLGLLIPISVL